MALLSCAHHSTISRSMFGYLRNNKQYFIGLAFLLVSGVALLALFGKSVTFKALNSYHPGLLNEFFINLTFMGDGIFALCLSALYLFYFKRKQQALALFSAFLLSGIIVQVVKNLVHAPRPKLFFEAGQYLHFIDGVTLSNNASFPSGHTTTTFAVATVLLLFLKNKQWQLPLLLLAALIGYSRIYLAQHFLLDVMIGAVIGTVSGLGVVYVVQHHKAIKRWWARRMQPSPTVASPTAMQPV